MPSDTGARRDALEGVRLGRYELVRRLAYGGMAEIFLARDSGVRGVTRNVVVKRILPNITQDRAFVEMFLDEARIAARLSHAAIAHVYDFGESEGQYYIAMEYVDGLSLSALLNACSPEPLPVEHAVRLGSLLAQALYYAHGLRDESGQPVGVIHRDVSPQNVLISRDGQVKLVDFGIAKAADSVHHTEVGVLKGKYAYMAPEQCIGLPYDHRVDIFSLGTVVHEALTGSRLFKRDNAFQTMAAVTTEPIPKPSDKRPGLPAALDDVVMRALARDPARRYPSADELAMDLERLMQREQLFSNEILLGRFLSSVVARRDELARATADDRAGPEPPAPSWSGSRSGAEAVSTSEISRLRRVVQAATAEPREAGPAEADADTAQHDISFLLESDGQQPEPEASAGAWSGRERRDTVRTMIVLPRAEAAADEAGARAGDPGPAPTEEIVPAGLGLDAVPTRRRSAVELPDDDQPTAVTRAADRDPPPDAPSQPREASSEVVRARVFRPSPRSLLLVGAAAAALAFVVAISMLGLRSVATEPDRPAGASPEPTTAGTAGDLPGPGSGLAPAPRPIPAEAADAAAAAPGASKLVVALERGDRVFLDGAEVEASRAASGLEVGSGTHRVRLERDGHRPWAGTVTVAAGATERIEPAPAPLPLGPGRLFINSRPWSRAFVDGRSVGNTPVVDLAVPPGRRTVKLVAQDGREERRAVTVRTGRSSKVFVQF